MENEKKQSCTYRLLTFFDVCSILFYLIFTIVVIIIFILESCNLIIDRPKSSLTLIKEALINHKKDDHKGDMGATLGATDESEFKKSSNSK